MEIHQVRYFLAVAETLNFTKAAERCNVSQPALTRAIQLLEHELGGLLFRRERANTHLTELGRMLQPFLQQSFEAAQRTKRLAEEFARAQKKTLKVGIMCTIAPDQIIDLITTMRSRNPEVELQLGDANAWDLEKQLLEGKLEIAIYCLPGKEPHERTHVMPLFREQIVIAINPSHRLATQNAIRVKDLDGETYIHRMNCEFAGYADPVFAAQNVKCKAAYWSDRDDWTLAMVAAGIGWAFMPANSVKHPGVTGIPITEPEFWRTVSLVSVRGREHTAPVGAFLREVMRHKWFGQTAISVERAGHGTATETAPIASRRSESSASP